MTDVIDQWTTVRLAPGQDLAAPVDHPRPCKLGKVFVTEETKAILGMLGEAYCIGPSGVAALLIEELRHQGQIEQVWKAHRNRRRKLRYHARHR